MGRRCVIVMCGLLISSVSSGCGGDGPAPRNDRITADALRADLVVLAGDASRGRLSGSPDLMRASDWIGARFESLGLEPAGDGGSFFQDFDLVWFTLGDGGRLSVDGAGGPRPPGEGWYPLNISATASVRGEVVFAGFGIVADHLGFDDYGGSSVDGKVVLMLQGEPGSSDPESPFDGVVTSEASRDWRKVLWAQDRGAAGVLFVRDVHNRPDAEDYAEAARAYWPSEPRRIERFSLGAWVERVEVPVAQISARLADALMSGTGRSLMEWATASETETGLGMIELPNARVALTVAVDRRVERGRNVLGMVEGADPDLRDEVVIIGAHHDHNGVDGDVVYNGADDDGSGTVGVMAVADAFAAAAAEGRRPRRSVLFAIWDAEERGLLGAWYYTLRPLFPLPSTRAVLNLDMIGRNEEVPEDGGRRFRGLPVQTAGSNANALNLLGYSRSPELARAVQDANSSYGLELRLRYDNNESNLLRRSDHWPFLHNGVPAVWFHTGLHPDYHTPDDDVDRIEFAKMERIVRLVHRTAWDVADAEVPGGEGG